ncbi:hydroxyisourate hydrolase [Bacillus alkalicellulosilyticus]|uniref:hydroxyisourate hydrolase n=1 Tax=Alkalihalobacterium alkalicellulosilyticum TaxID=1912214 RepID=UPI00099664C6|nr:hydroxyisourate hydrolase [Bacillus alkalicellulosilyticus]
MGQLTTHVLDISCGQPASEMKVEVWRRSTIEKKLLKTFYTNDDGRVDKPILEKEELKIGTYELIFFVGDYYARQGGRLREFLFLDLVPIRFCITSEQEHYHVPLLVAPGGYSTYRGS